MDNSKKITRKEMREEAFKLSFELLLNDSPLDEIVDNANEADDINYSEYALDCANGILQHKDELDEYIAKYLKTGWKLSRISKVSYAILRLALYEILYVDSVPTPVAINEAVELAKKYTIPDDSSFINGILGNFVKDNG